MEYRSIQNRSRAVRGGQLIRSHPDYGHMTGSCEREELFTAASDSVADILHALNANGVFGDFDGVSVGLLSACEDMLTHAVSGFEGDFEDELDT